MTTTAQRLLADEVTGVWVALPTPWDTRNRVDDSTVHRMVTAYAQAGIHGVYTGGTDGEWFAQDRDDFVALARVLSEATRAVGLPLQLGVTAMHTREVLERVRVARDFGVGCVQVALPAWVPLRDPEVDRFFGAIHDAAPEVSIVHYNIAQTGRFLTGADYRRIVGVAPTLIGSKHTGGDMESLRDITSASPSMTHLVVDTQIVAGAAAGARGFYSLIANASPQLALRLWAAACEPADPDEAARTGAIIDRLFADWLATTGSLSSPALNKVAAAAGLDHRFPLKVREPYESASLGNVATLGRLLVAAQAQAG